jgi:hypothetical protein
MAGCFLHTFSRPSGGRGQQDPEFQCPENLDDGFNDGRFTRTRATGDNQELFLCR